MIDEILNRIWKKNEPSTIIDTSFVENVIKPAMEEYAQEQVKLLTIPGVSITVCDHRYHSKNGRYMLYEGWCEKCGTDIS